MLARADEVDPELLADTPSQRRVAFVAVVPASGGNPDAVSGCVKPGGVPTELAETLDRYVVLPRIALTGRPNLSATEVISEVQS